MAVVLEDGPRSRLHLRPSLPFMSLITNRIPDRHAADIQRAARRIVRFTNARLPLEYIGIGMTGVVFCDARGRAFKAARNPDQAITRQMIAEEAQWLAIASTVPEIRRHVTRLHHFHRGPSIIERECIREDESARRRKDVRFDLHLAIGRAMSPYGLSAPEFKNDSYVYSRGRGWILVDASMPHLVGARLVARAVQTLRGKSFYNERPSDIAFALRMESDRTVAPAVALRLSERLLALPETKRAHGHRRDPRSGRGYTTLRIVDA